MLEKTVLNGQRQTETDRDRQERGKEREKKNGKIKGQHGKERIKKLRIYFKKSEDTSLGKSMDPLKFLEKFEI